MDLSLLNIGTNKNNRFIGSLSNDRDEEYRLAGYVEELDRFLNKGKRSIASTLTTISRFCGL